jgi:hypothetical protein
MLKSPEQFDILTPHEEKLLIAIVDESLQTLTTFRDYKNKFSLYPTSLEEKGLILIGDNIQVTVKGYMVLAIIKKNKC